MLRRRGEMLGSSGKLRSRVKPAATGEGKRLGTRFKMCQRLFAIVDRFVIEDEHGDRVFQVENKVFRLRKTLNFQNLQGNDVYKIQEKVAHIRDTMEIEQEGRVVAKIHNTLMKPLRDRWKIDIPEGEGLMARGNILNHEYKMFRGEQIIGVVSKKWSMVRDAYSVDVREGENALLVLAIVAAIDNMSHEGR